MQVPHIDLRNFCHNLRLAVYDRQLERDGKTITYFYDSDFIYAALLGFRGRAPRGQHSTNFQSKLAGSLLFQGYLGRARLLHAHLYEIDLSLRTKDEFVGQVGGGDFIAAVKRYLEVADVTENLKSLLRELDERGERSIPEILSKSNQLDVRTFVALEQAGGDWRQRLRTIGRNLDFSAGKFAMKDLASHPDLTAFRNEIDIRRKKRGDGAFWKNTLRDALALIELRRRIEEFDSDPSQEVEIVRFYTNTDVLHEIWREIPRIRELLTYQSLGSDKDANFAVRDAEYFHLRAYFPSLRMEGLTLATQDDWEDEAEFTELSIISERLRGLDENLSIEDTGVFQVRGRSLLEHIEELTSRTFFRRIWLQFRIPDSLIRAMAELKAVELALRDAEFSSQFQEELSADIRRAREELSASAHDFAAFFDLFTNLRGRQQDLLSALGERKRYVEMSDPNRDFGLVRWGISLTLESCDRFRSLVSAILGIGDEPDRSEDALLDLAGSMRDVRGDLEQTALLASVLWFLGDYDLASVLIRKSLESRPAWEEESRVALELMGAASKLRGRHVLTTHARIVLLEEAEEGIRLLGKNAKRFAVGHAFLYFHAARGEEWVFGDREPNAREIEWATISLEKVSPLLEDLDKTEPLLGAFALNHYVYVSLALRRTGNELSSRLAQLKALELQGGVWNYRFIDTTSLLEFRIYTEALQKVREGGGAEDIEHLYKQIRNAVASEAERYRRCNDFGDPEISVHLAKWRWLEADALSLKVAQSFVAPASIGRELPRGEIRDPL